MGAAAATLALLLGATGGPAWVEPRAAVEVVVRARADEATTPGRPATLLELRPSARLLTRTPAVRLSLEYRPRLFTGLSHAPLWTGVQHVADVVADWDLSRALKLRALQRAAYGYEDFGYIEFGDRTWSLDVRPPPVAEYARSQTELSATVQPHLRFGANVAVGYALSGALRTADQVSVPLQRGPYLSATGLYALTRRDTLMTQVWSAYVLSNDDRTSGVFRISEIWRHQLDRSTRTDLGAGIGALSRTREGRADVDGVLPIASAGVTHRTRLDRKDAELRLEGKLAPHLSTLTGDAYYRAETFGSATVGLMERATLRARLGASTELGPADQPERLLMGDLGALYPIRNDLTVSAGALGLWQKVSGAATAPTFQWSVYVSLVARTDAR